jgi:hypothetical protein
MANTFDFCSSKGGAHAGGNGVWRWWHVWFGVWGWEGGGLFDIILKRGDFKQAIHSAINEVSGERFRHISI